MTSDSGDGSTVLARAFARIDSDFDDHLETIRTFLRQPSVSSTGEGVELCAGMVAELIEACGGRGEVIATDGHPTVIASYRRRGAQSSALRDVRRAATGRTRLGGRALRCGDRDLPGIGAVA